MGRRSTRHQHTRNNPASTITDIFILMGDIGGRGQGKKREGKGEKPQGPVGGGEGNNRVRGTEQGHLWKAARRNRDEVEDDRAGKDDGRGGA